MVDNLVACEQPGWVFFFSFSFPQWFLNMFALLQKVTANIIVHLSPPGTFQLLLDESS
jgi:hypothetical protein